MNMLLDICAKIWLIVSALVGVLSIVILIFIIMVVISFMFSGGKKEKKKDE